MCIPIYRTVLLWIAGELFLWINLVDYLLSWWTFQWCAWIELQRRTKPKPHENEGKLLSCHSILFGCQTVKWSERLHCNRVLFEYDIDSIILFRFIAELNDIYEFIVFAFVLFSLLGVSCTLLMLLSQLVEYLTAIHSFNLGSNTFD